MRRIPLLIGSYVALVLPAGAWGTLSGDANILNPQVKPQNISTGLPASDDNFGAGGYPVAGGICAERGHQVPCSNHYSTTRASTKYVTAFDGLIILVPANTMAIGQGTGALLEDARTNTALWSRDMTNAAWTKVTMTVALNAIGMDGFSNSASTLTATGALASALQTLVLGSVAENYSVWLKRVTGSGAVKITLNNLVGSTTCTVTDTVNFTRCTITSTLANPVIGIQLATSGDVVVADFNQLEAGSFPTSQILTTSASATRNADNVVAPANSSLAKAINGSAGLIYTQFNVAQLPSASGRFVDSNSQPLFNINNTSNGQLTQNGAGVTTANTYTLSASSKLAGSWGSQNSLVLNAGTVVTGANGTPGTSAATPQIGNRTALDRGINGYMARLTLGNLEPSAAILQSFTLP